MRGIQRNLWKSKDHHGRPQDGSRVGRTMLDEAGGAIVEMAHFVRDSFAMFFGVFELSFASIPIIMLPLQLARAHGSRSSVVPRRARTLRTCPTAMQAIQ